MKMKNLTLLLALLGAVIFFEACDDDEQPSTTTEVELDMDYKVGSEDFALGQVFNIGGVAVSFDVANFYMSGISFMTDNMEEIAIDGKTLLITPEDNEQLIAELERGHYHRILFDVGVAPADNSQSEEDFTTRADDDPLSRQQPPMHWNWNAGYIFFRIDGLVDTDGDGTPETAMEYHVGTDSRLTSLDITLHEDLDQEHSHVALQVDFVKLFEGIDLSANFNVHVSDNPTAADAFIANFATAFTAQ